MTGRVGATSAPPDEPSDGPSDGPGDAPRNLPFRPDVQGLRAVAVLLVVAFHSGLAPKGGFLGVDVFFVISGFVIGRLLLAEQTRSGTVALGRFYARRIRRLLPALVIVLGFVAIVSILALGPLGSLRETTRNTGVGAALYVANFAILKYQNVGYFDLVATTNPLLHTWTLGVEEQFYLFFPLFLIGLGFLARTVRRGKSVIALGIGVAMVVSFLAWAILNGTIGAGSGPVGTHGRFAFYASPTRAWEFLVGVCVALVEVRLARIDRRVTTVVTAIGLVAIASAAWLTEGTDPNLGLVTVAPVLGAAMVIGAGVSGSVIADRILATRPMTWIGDRSYGWYLWHWPLMVFAKLSFPAMSNWAVLAVGVAALVPTEISYRLVERPIRRNPAWLGRRAVATAILGSSLAILLLVGVSAWAPTPDVAAARLQRDLDANVGPPTQCYPTGSSQDPNAKSACLWRVPDARGKIIVIGDSHAWAINDGFVAAAQRAGYDENLIFRPGCPFADVVRVVDAETQAACQSFIADKTAAIIREHPALVVLASNQDTDVQSDDYTLRDPVSGRTGTDVATRAAIWQAGLTRTLATFADEGIPTVVVSTVPMIRPFDLQLCPAWRLWVEPIGCARTVPRSRIDAAQRAGRAATAAAVRAVPGSALVDFADDLCEPTRCSTYFAGTWNYRDETHLSPAGTSLLVPRIEREVIPAARGRD